MIKTLRKKIHFVLLLLFAMIWITMLGMFAWNTYQDNLDELRTAFRTEIRENSWKHFIRTKGADCDFGGVEYCVFSTTSDKQVTLLFSTFTDLSEEQMLEYGRYIAHNEKTASLHGYTYVPHLMKNYGRVYVLISADTAFRQTIPVLTGCILAAVGGLLLFSLAARTLARWFVRPVEETLLAEKQFISDASHELKTPLAVIRANTELLAAECDPDNKHLRYIRQEADRMTELVSQMLTLARLDAPQANTVCETFAADEALFDIIYPLESVAYERNITIQTDIQSPMRMDGNRTQLQSLASILLNNAITYNSGAGEILVHADIHSRQLYLSVANTGEPIPADVQEHLFERFYRADEAHSDNRHFGLGLSIAHKIVTNSGGKISFTRKDGKNVFAVCLPAVRHG